jgi:hypothetical protein
MTKCQWNNCTNQATKEVSRIVHDAGPKEPNTLSGEVETIAVCDDHLGKAQTEYSDTVNPISDE